MPSYLKIESALKKMIEGGHLPKILLFSGVSETCKMEAAQFFISHLIGKVDPHPDIKIYEPESKNESYTVAQIDDFIHEVALLPFEASYRFFIFKEAHKLKPLHGNRLLKSFEEMPEHAFVLLMAESSSLLLETIVSRAVTFHFSPTDQNSSSTPKEVTASQEAAIEKGVLSALFSMYAGQIDQAAAFLQEIEPLIEEQKGPLFTFCLDKLFLFIRDLHYLKETGIDKDLYYAEHKEVIQKIILSKIPSLEIAKKIIFDAIDGFERNIKLKAILQQVVIKLVHL